MPPAPQLRQSTLTFAAYVALSTVPVGALGAVLDHTYRGAAFEQGLAQGRAQAAVIEEMAVSPALSGDDLTAGLSESERRRLSAATDLAVDKGSVVRLRLRDFDGRVVFSDDGRVDEAVPAASRPFREAAVGRTSAELVDTPAGPAVLVLRPVVARASGRSTGVLELQLPYARIAAAVDAQVDQAWRRVLVGLVLLYAVLAGLAWSTSRRRLAEAVRTDDTAARLGGHEFGLVLPHIGDEPQSLALQAELWSALERDELVLHYQPAVDLRTGEVPAVEALVRWQHPQRGLLGPDEFLPAVEASGLVGPFTTWVLARALEDLQEWTATGRDWSVAVNVSARNLETPGFAAHVAAQLAVHRVPASRVVLEITEAALASDDAALGAGVLELEASGVRVSVDDFGTGWSSLTQLRALRVVEVKIDRSFVQLLDDEPQDGALVRSVIDLAHGLGCRVTAEGVEHSSTADWLRAAGCDQAQGFLWSRPAPWRELDAHRSPASDPATAPPGGLAPVLAPASALRRAAAASRGPLVPAPGALS